MTIHPRASTKTHTHDHSHTGRNISLATQIGGTGARSSSSTSSRGPRRWNGFSLSVLGGRWKRRRARVRTEAYTAGETTYVFGITAINAVSPVCFALDPPTLVQTSIATLFRNQPSVDFIHCYGLRLLRRREYPTDVVVWLLASMFSFFPCNLWRGCSTSTRGYHRGAATHVRRQSRDSITRTMLTVGMLMFSFELFLPSITGVFLVYGEKKL